MPVEAYSGLAEVAKARGVDVSSIINWVVADYLPALKLRTNLSGSLSSGPGTGEALRIVRDLLSHLQDVYAALSKRAISDGERRAG
jgi:hypothetical protein